MTNAQKWIAIFLGLFIVLLIITYATEPNEGEAITEETALSGEKIYADLQCASCHGNDLQGTEQAPPLLNLAEKWSKTDLINYLRNPDDYKTSENILKLKEKYPDSFMPAFDGVETKKLGELANFLLER